MKSIQKRTQSLVITMCLLLPAIAAGQPIGSPPYGTSLGSGTLTVANPKVTFSDGPFIVPNVSAQASILNLAVSVPSTPTCTSTPALPGAPLSTNQCDFFTLASAASTLAATHNIQFTVTWPDANNPTDQSEFDLYVYDSSGNVVASAFSGTASPRMTTLPIPSDGTQYTVQIVPFNPEGFSYTATAQLVAKPVFNPPPPNPGAARFQTYMSPAGLGENAGEPSIGIDWTAKYPTLKHGTVNQGGVSFFQSGPNTLRVSFDDCSSPAGHQWDDVSTPLVQQFVLSDPIGFVDSTTGRVFSVDLIGGEGNSFMAYSDNDGASWTPAQGGGIPGGPDHETLGGGAYASSPANTGAVYSNAIYYCGQDIAPEAQCSVSLDGGLTFGPGVPIYQTAQCAANGSIHGHVKVGPDGSAYVPSGSCSAGPGVAFTRDNGVTWNFSAVPNTTDSQNLDPSVAIDAANNVYLIWLDGRTNHPYVSVSTDHGTTWSTPYDVGATFNIQNADFVISTAGDAGRAAVGFVGTTVSGNPQSDSFAGVWHLYIASSFDKGKSWTTQDVTPNDPVQLGCIWTSGGSNPCRNLLDFNDMRIDSQGRLEVAFAKGCLASANCTAATATLHGPPYAESEASKAVIARQSGGLRMFAAFDPPLVGAPATPKLDGANVDPVTGQITLGWETPDNGGAAIKKYNIYRGASPGNEVLYAAVDGSRTSFADTKVTAKTTYYYYVTAANSAGESGHCAEVASVAAAGSTQSPCNLPGVTLGTSPAGNQAEAPANAALDITEVDVAEPYPSPAGTSSVVFTIQVSNLAQLPQLQPNSEWEVRFNVADTNGVLHTMFVEADTNDATAPNGKFGYGYLSGSTEAGEGSTGVTGTFNFNSSSIIIILDTSKPIQFTPAIGSSDLPFTVNLAAGSQLSGLSSKTTLLLGAQPAGIGGGLLESVDSTNAGAYTLHGNGFCRPDGPVLAVIQAQPNTGCQPLTVNFDGSQSFDAAGDPLTSYTFNFGDGSNPVTQSGPTATHTYTSSGNYVASLTATCSRGATSKNVAQAQVSVGANPGRPSITAPATAKSLQSGLTASVASHAGSRYSWAITNGTITGGAGTSQITFTSGAKGQTGLSVTEIATQGCASPAGTATVTVK